MRIRRPRRLVRQNSAARTIVLLVRGGEYSSRGTVVITDGHMAGPAVPAPAKAAGGRDLRTVASCRPEVDVVSVVSPLVWAVTVVALLAIIVLDLTVITRRQRTVSTTDAVRWVLVYVGLAAVFAAGLFVFLPGSAGQQFVAG